MWTTLGFVIASVLFIGFLINSFLQRQRSFWKSKGIYVFENQLNLFQLFKGKMGFDFDFLHYKELESKGLPYGGNSEMGTPVLVVRDLELIKSILVKDFDNFIDRRSLAGSDPLFGKSVFFMEGQNWKNMRSALSPTFSSGKLRLMFEQFDISGQKLFAYVKEQCPKTKSNGYDVSLDEILRRYSVDVIGSVAYGMETNALKEKDSDFLKYAVKASNFDLGRLFRISLLSNFPKLAKLLKIQLLDSGTANFFQGIIRSAIRMRETTGERRNDFLQLLLDARNAFRNKKSESELTGDIVPYDFSDEIINAQAFTFFFAGFDAGANVLRNFLYIMSAHPDIQEKLREEVLEKVQLANGKVTYDCVTSMEYMEMVMSETLRYLTPTGRLERKCMSDYKLPGGEILPKNTIVVIPVVGIQKDKNYYPNPDQFNPEQFTQERKNERNPYSYLSFGQGPRHCIAQRFALMEVKAAAAHILKKFRIEPSEKFPLPLRWESIFGAEMSPKDAIVQFIPISNN